MKPYAELLEYNQTSKIRKEGYTRVRDAFSGLSDGNPERIMEFAGRWDYGQNNAEKLGELSRFNGEMMPIIRKYLAMGHESMIEMGDATFFIECSRVVSHELIRHRIGSFQQESQRFVKYDDEDIERFMYQPDDSEELPVDYHSALMNAAEAYKMLRKNGIAPQIARYVLPNAMRTRLIMKTNIREWRHIIKLRLDKSAQPEMRELMEQIYDQLIDIFPNALYGVMDGERGVR
jgi:thymidylate synthase (FAD)